MKYNAIALVGMRNWAYQRIMPGELVRVFHCNNQPEPAYSQCYFVNSDSGIEVMRDRADVLRFDDVICLDEAEVQLWNVLLALFASIRRR